MRRAFLSASIMNVLAMVFIFIEGVLLARYLGPEGRGAISMYMAAFLLVFPLATLGVKQSTAYSIGKANIEYSSMCITQWRFLPISVVLLTTILLLLYWWMGLLTDTLLIIVMLIAFNLKIMLDYISGFAIGTNNVVYQYSSELVRSSVSIVFLIGIIIFNKLSIFVYFAIQCFSQFIVMLYVLTWLPSVANSLKSRRGTGSSFSYVEFCSRGIRYSLPLFIMGLNYSSDILLLGKLASDHDVGIYAAAVALASMTWFFPNLLASMFFSRSISTHSKGETEATHYVLNKLKIIMVIMLLFVISLVIMSETIVVNLYGGDFFESINVIYILMPGIYLMILFKILNSELSGRGITDLAIKVFSTTFIINLALNIILIPEYTYLGAAIATSVSYSLGALCFTAIYYTKYIKLK